MKFDHIAVVVLLTSSILCSPAWADGWVYDSWIGTGMTEQYSANVPSGLGCYCTGNPSFPAQTDLHGPTIFR